MLICYTDHRNQYRRLSPLPVMACRCRVRLRTQTVWHNYHPECCHSRETRTRGWKTPASFHPVLHGSLWLQWVELTCGEEGSRGEKKICAKKKGVPISDPLQLKFHHLVAVSEIITAIQELVLLTSKELWLRVEGVLLHLPKLRPLTEKKKKKELC